jgi:hypothetical protein
LNRITNSAFLPTRPPSSVWQDKYQKFRQLFVYWPSSPEEGGSLLLTSETLLMKGLVFGFLFGKQAFDFPLNTI